MEPENLPALAPIRHRSFDLPVFAPQTRLRLSGARADTYVRLLVKMLRAGRLSRSFPDPQGLIALYGLLAPASNHYNYDGFEIGTRTGLPVEPEVSRVQADHAIAEKVVRREHSRKPARAQEPAAASTPHDDRYERLFRYHRAVMSANPAAAFKISLDLRNVDPERRRASFVTVLDRFDLSEELFCRYTILLTHTADRWVRRQVRLEGEDLEHTHNFQNLIAKTTAADSEVAFILLSDIPSLRIESITRTRVGPLSMAGTTGIPELQRLLDAHPGELILSLTTDRTSLDINRDSNGDPFTRTYREQLPSSARELVNERRSELGYGVRHDRKLVCTRNVADALRALLREQGRACVVYEMV